jgi:type IV secretory pathway VirD2 relaxase
MENRVAVRGYLQRDGATRDGSPSKVFDAPGDEADGRAFAKRCEGDRHHFRLIVLPEDVTETELCVQDAGNRRPLG